VDRRVLSSHKSLVLRQKTCRIRYLRALSHHAPDKLLLDIYDGIALLLAARGEMDVEKVREAVAKKALKDAIALLTSSYQQTARFYPLSMAEYKKLKAALEKWIP